MPPDMFKELRVGGAGPIKMFVQKERKTLKIHIFFCGVHQFEDFRLSRSGLEPNPGGKRRKSVV
jgi:hypothetical protein